jgi:hypothetical protein
MSTLTRDKTMIGELFSNPLGGRKGSVTQGSTLIA